MGHPVSNYCLLLFFSPRRVTAIARDNRNYLTAAIGCTGGQHRSVYLVERLAQAFSPRYQVLVRHRELAPDAGEPHARDGEQAG
jgi:UPF0042 nucleotide-binding protein